MDISDPTHGKFTHEKRLNFSDFFSQILWQWVEETVQNPLDWAGVITFYAYLEPIIKILKVFNCSANFFAYLCLRAKEKKLQKLQQTKKRNRRTGAPKCLKADSEKFLRQE